MSIESSDGTPAASYCYDAWGKILASTGELAELNPLRYRGYVCDQETGFYYLQSRYYDPIICRFVSADSYTSTGQGVSGHDMFIYCNNNPVANVDIAGFWTVSVSITVSGVFGVGVSGSFGFAFDGHGNLTGSMAMLSPELAEPQ